MIIWIMWLPEQFADGAQCKVVQFFMGLSITVASSRQMWAFSRDGALPFSNCKSDVLVHGRAKNDTRRVCIDQETVFRPISKTFGYIPLRTIWGCKSFDVWRYPQEGHILM